jgi:4'-phosphopantetheinyl transferase
LNHLSLTLSPDERERADRYRFARDRACFITGRGTLRCILARYIGCRPGDLGFSYGPQGRPELDERTEHKWVHFNVSHSGAFALYGVAWDRRIGVDLECVRGIPEALSIARHFFSPSEYRALLTATPEKRQSQFFWYWTRKEAFLKATGDGLAHPLRNVEILNGPGDSARLLVSNGQKTDEAGWSLGRVVPPEGYEAALVVEGRNIGTEMFLWDYTGRFS